MSDGTERSPGWYTDPEHANRLAYWDGGKWTGEHRPRPSWQGTDPAAVAAEEREARRRWAHGPRSWILVAGVLALVVGLAWITLPKPDDPGPKVLTDAAFISSANRQCKATIPYLRPVIVTDSTVPNPQIAADVDRVADGLVGLARQLRAMPAAPGDQPHIAGWLDGWERYAAVGHRYAAALRADDLRAQIDAGQEGDKVQKATDRFARANDIEDCQFFIAPRGTGRDPFSGGM